MVISVIKDSDIGLKNKKLLNPKTRTAARGILISGDKIGLFHKAKKNEYKLPGGGIDDGETPEQAFLREIMEETGCEVEIIEKLGTIEEWKSYTNFKQVSHVFVAKLVKDTKQLHLTEKEIAEGGEFLWVTLDEAISLVKGSFDKLVASSDESIYMTQFIIKRDESILKYYKNHIK